MTSQSSPRIRLTLSQLVSGLSRIDKRPATSSPQRSAPTPPRQTPTRDDIRVGVMVRATQSAILGAGRQRNFVRGRVISVSPVGNRISNRRAMVEWEAPISASKSVALRSLKVIPPAPNESSVLPSRETRQDYENENWISLCSFRKRSAKKYSSQMSADQPRSADDICRLGNISDYFGSSQQLEMFKPNLPERLPTSTYENPVQLYTLLSSHSKSHCALRL